MHQHVEFKKIHIDKNDGRRKIQKKQCQETLRILGNMAIGIIFDQIDLER
jgi:hypothetical protein